jgi:uncharacterized protein YdeI (BOF family)
MEKQYAKSRIIKDITNNDDRIQITGYIKSIESEYIFLDDKTGEVRINIKDLAFNHKKNDLINVIGNLIINTAGEKFIQADIIQDMNKLNFKYYMKLYELKKELKLIE